MRAGCAISAAISSIARFCEAVSAKGREVSTLARSPPLAMTARPATRFTCSRIKPNAN
jgi:hypothetical protein